MDSVLDLLRFDSCLSCAAVLVTGCTRTVLDRPPRFDDVFDADGLYGFVLRYVCIDFGRLVYGCL